MRAEVARWRSHAQAIPDAELRAHACAALADKRPLLDGAALFWVILRARRPALARWLVAFQILANFHDHAGERAASEGRAQPAGVVSALGEAMDPRLPLPVTYGPGGSYLRSLAVACRRAAVSLPDAQALSLVLREVRRGQAMDIEHATAGASRATQLRGFAQAEFGARADIEWWELTAGAGSMLTAIAAVAVASNSASSTFHVGQTIDAYTWAGAVGTLLDHYIDHAADGVTGAHNYLNYYTGLDVAVDRLEVLIDRALREVGALRRGERHRVIVASMVAMYLTSRSARGPALRSDTERLVAAGGSLTRLLVPILQAWRVAYDENDA